MHIKSALFFLYALVSTGYSELSPAVYEDKQRQAPEYLRIQVADISVSPDGTNPSISHVRMLAIVDGVMRTNSNIRIGNTIQIVYTVTSRRKSWCGPGEIPILKIRETRVAYLAKLPNSESYTPAAGAMSFNDF